MLLILILSVAVGVYLVSQSQDIRNKAYVQTTQTVTVCHRTGLADKPLLQMSVPLSKLNSYIDTGDTVGECPTPTISPTSKAEK